MAATLVSTENSCSSCPELWYSLLSSSFTLDYMSFSEDQIRSRLAFPIPQKTQQHSNPIPNIPINQPPARRLLLVKNEKQRLMLQLKTRLAPSLPNSLSRSVEIKLRLTKSQRGSRSLRDPSGRKILHLAPAQARPKKTKTVAQAAMVASPPTYPPGRDSSCRLFKSMVSGTAVPALPVVDRIGLAADGARRAAAANDRRLRARQGRAPRRRFRRRIRAAERDRRKAPQQQLGKQSAASSARKALQYQLRILESSRRPSSARIQEWRRKPS